MRSPIGRCTFGAEPVELCDSNAIGGYGPDISLRPIHLFLLKWKQKQTSVVIDATAELRKEQPTNLAELTGTTREVLERDLHLAILQCSLPLPVSVETLCHADEETSPRKRSLL